MKEHRFWKSATAIAAAVCLWHSPMALAAPSWHINPDGTGIGGAYAVSTIDVAGTGFVQIIPDSADPGSFNFVEHGAYQLLQPGTGDAFSTTDITVTYAVSGTGSFFDPLALSFTDGTIALYADSVHDFGTENANFGADNGTSIASFSVVGGGVSASGLVTVSATLDLGSLAAGYLFAADGTDLSATAGTTMELGVFNQVVVPDPLLVSEIVCGLSAYTGPGCEATPTVFANSPFAYTVQDGGYAALNTVPEPGSMYLLLGALGLAVGSRRSLFRSEASSERQSI